MIEKQLEKIDMSSVENAGDAVVVEIVDDSEPDIDPEEVAAMEETLASHDTNLADYIDENELRIMSASLIDAFSADVQSRDEWADAYAKGLDLMGLKVEERVQPFRGASGVFHPILAESVIRFQAQAMSELYPATGPADTKLMGEIDEDLAEQAVRVKTELNYIITEKMVEFRDELECLTFRLPLAGSAFKKVYYDPIEERPVSVFVPAEDFVTSYGTTNLRTAERFTHCMKKSADEVKKLMAAGLYSEIDLPTATPEKTDIQEKYDKINGRQDQHYADERHTLLEMHVMLEMPEPFEHDGTRPYIVTIDKTSGKILSIYRNWDEDDPKYRRIMHFVHYRYLPGMGFYGLGMIHILGGLTKTATAILRQLIDAGTFSNLPAGLKTRSLRVSGDNTPFRPGEFRDIEATSGAIKDNIHFLPYKEPSAVLHRLLLDVVEEARRIGSVADLDVGNMSKDAPVGTTIALLERSMKVMSAVQARMHAAMKDELKLIARCIYMHMPDKYDYKVDDNASRRKDFDGRVDVIPVSDPNATTMAQRVVQYQAAIQLAQQAPQFYKVGKLHKQMLRVLGVQDVDDIIELPEDVKPMDPITENMAILTQEPVKAFMYQDHEAHIRTHMAAMQDPKILQLVGQSPFASAIQSAMMEHINEHVALGYRREIEKTLGVPLPDPEAPLPEDVELELSRVAAQAAEKLLGKDKAEAAAQQAAEQAQDPLTQIQMRELALKEMKAKAEIEEKMKRLELDRERLNKDVEVQIERIRSENKRKGAEIGARVAESNAKIKSAEKIKGVELGLDIAKNLSDGNEVKIDGDTNT